MIAKVPLALIHKVPEELVTGFFRLATHIIVWSAMLLYHRPRYRLVVLAGVKKPKAKRVLEDIRISLSARGWAGVMTSLEVQEERKIESSMRRNDLLFPYHGFTFIFMRA